MNKNLKLKRTSYITLKYISYKSVLKKNTFQIQVYYLWYGIFFLLYTNIVVQFNLLLEFYLVVNKICKGAYIKKKGGGEAWKAARKRVIFKLLKVLS